MVDWNKLNPFTTPDKAEMPTPEERYNRIAVNVKKLLDAGLPETEIDNYLKERENMTRFDFMDNYLRHGVNYKPIYKEVYDMWKAFGKE